MEYESTTLPTNFRWPHAAEGGPGRQPAAIDRSMWPVRTATPHLADFLAYPVTPLSSRAIDGFMSRAARSSLHFPAGLLTTIGEQREATRALPVPIAS